MKWLRIYRDPLNDAGSIGEAVLSELTAQENATPEVKTEETPKAETKTKFAWGDEDRRKERASFKDEDELDLGYEDEVEGKKVPAKVKVSEVKQTAKFLKENGDVIRAALSMREDMKANPDLAKAFQAFYTKAFEGGKYNPENVAKFSSFLEGKAEYNKEQIAETTDEIKEMEASLEELDPDSAHAKILRQNIKTLKATRQELKSAQETIKALQDKAKSIDDFKSGIETKEKTAQEESEAREARKVYDAEIDAITAEGSKDGYRFEDAEDAEEFKKLVEDKVAEVARTGAIKNDDQFKKAIREAAKLSYEKISRRNEAIVNRYLTKKGAVKKEEKQEEKPKEDKELSIGEQIAAGMFDK